MALLDHLKLGERRQKLTPQQIEIGRSLATDPTRSVTSIYEHLTISRPTFYRYINPVLNVITWPTIK